MSLCDWMTQEVAHGLRALLRRRQPALGHADPVHVVVDLARSALLVACVVHLFPEWLAPLEVPAFTVASNVASRMAGTPAASTGLTAALALVEIDQARFDDAYEGTSPLSRCKLAEDLGRLRKALKTVAVDLDLSPTRRADPKGCQEGLDQLLDDLGPRALLIRPIGGADASAWVCARRDKGVQFGVADLDLRYGMVRSYTAGSARTPHFAELLGARLQGEPVPSGRCSGSPGPAADPGQANKTHPVAFYAAKRLHAGGNAVPIDSPCVIEGGSEAACAGVEHVLVGGTYGSDDEFITPIGTLPGMYIHAAIAAKPRHPDHPLMALAVDVLIGIGFGYVLHKLWGLYFRQRLVLQLREANRSTHATTRPKLAWDPRLAYLWLILLVLVYLAVVVLLALASIRWFSEGGLWISPVAMAVGMAIDGFVLGGPEVGQHLMQKFRTSTDSLAQELPVATPRKPSRLANFFAGLPCVTGLFIIAWALFKIFNH
jgi:hypothetical protein